MLNLFYSNRTEVLCAELKKELFCHTHPFQRRLIVVSSLAMKGYLMQAMAEDPSLGIATGIEICTLSQLFERLQQLFGIVSEEKLLSSMELALIIEKEIRQAFHLEKENVLWQPLFEYLNLKVSSKKGDKRLTHLSRTLASLFLRYAQYGEKLIFAWENAPETTWQQALWKRVFSPNHPERSFLHRKLAALDHKKAPVHPQLAVHLFALPALSEQVHAFLQDLSNTYAVHYYQLSPCQLFWSDLASQKERKKWEYLLRKGKISEAQYIQLDEFLSDQNALLANFAMIGKKMWEYAESAQVKEDYLLPECALPACYQEHLTEVPAATSTKSLTLLEAIQTDMLLLRNPEKSKISFDTFDRSLQIHTAPSPMREVQILYDLLLDLMQKYADTSHPLLPSEIVVLAPHLEVYAPFINAIFNAPDSLVEGEVCTLPAHTSQPLTQGFLQLLALAKGRWDYASLMQLFSSPFFMQKVKWQSEHLKVIEGWLTSCGVRWGMDSAHRDEILKEQHCRYGMVEKTPIGTWEHALERLYAALIQKPTEKISSLESTLLGQLDTLLYSLKADLAAFNNDTQFTLKEWKEYLLCLLETYFAHDECQEVYDSLCASLEKLAHAAHFLEEATYPFSTLEAHLQALLSQPQHKWKVDSLGAIRFCALESHRAIPKRVIVLLGMEEGTFPRRSHPFSLDHLKSFVQKENVPSEEEEDRYLFLEALLSAREHLLLLHSTSATEEKMPSPILRELKEYCDHAYTIAGEIASTHITCTHPLHAYDLSYFSNQAELRSFSKQEYQLCRSMYTHEKQERIPFLSHFMIPKQEPSIDRDTLTLEELTHFAKNPIRSYFVQSLKMRPTSFKKTVFPTEEEFCVPRWQLFDLKKAALHSNEGLVLDHSPHQPLGSFKAASLHSLIEEISHLQRSRDQLGISPNAIVSLTFSHQEKRVRKNVDGSWSLPALKIPYKDRFLYIEGQISHATEKGLLFAAQPTLKELIKIWPQYLIFHSLVQQNELPLNPQLLLLSKSEVKTPFTEPVERLTHFLNYYLKGLQTASPLIPEWVEYFLTLEKEPLQKKIEGTLNNPFHPIYNDYLLWSIEKESTHTIAEWQPLAQALFKDLYTEWKL